MRYVFVLAFFILSIFTGCKKKEKIEFILNSLTLKSFKKENLPNQKLFIKVVMLENSSDEVLATTDKYPSEYTLPTKFGLDNPIKMNFYKNTYVVELHGDSTGYIGRNTININDYKILYALDLETEKDGLGIILSGTWR